MKNILLISGSPRKNGNSELLCQAFQKGAEEAGHKTELVRLQSLKIGACVACYGCRGTGVCVQKDDMEELLEKLLAADVIVFSTPVYFYNMSGQLKTMIDRMLPRYRDMKDKEFYFIATAAEEKSAMERTMDSLTGAAQCLPGAKIMGKIYGEGVYQKGEVNGTAAIEEAYQYGKKA